MNKSKNKFSTRCRPALGTLVRARLSCEDDKPFELVYREIAAAEAIFSYFLPESELSKFNRGERTNLSARFHEVFEISHRLRALSAGAFSPFVGEQIKQSESGGFQIDFGGIAKGYAVDLAVTAVRSEFPELSGYVEAGGEIRYFGDIERTATVRLGIPPNVNIRQIEITHDAIATSAPEIAYEYGTSSRTRFGNTRWLRGTSVVVLASRCIVADALTKVALAADLDVVRKISSQLDATCLYFDQRGALIESAS